MHEVDDAVGNCCSLLHGVTGSRYVAKVVLISGYRTLALERISRGNPAVAVRHLLCRQIALKTGGLAMEATPTAPPMPRFPPIKPFRTTPIASAKFPIAARSDRCAMSRG